MGLLTREIDYDSLPTVDETCPRCERQLHVRQVDGDDVYSCRECSFERRPNTGFEDASLPIRAYRRFLVAVWPRTKLAGGIVAVVGLLLFQYGPHVTPVLGVVGLFTGLFGMHLVLYYPSIFCPDCGRQHPKHDGFCRNCGTQLHENRSYLPLDEADIPNAVTDGGEQER